MGGEKPSAKLDTQAEKINSLLNTLETESDKTQDLLRQHKLKQAAVKLKEVDKLITQLTDLKVDLSQDFKDVIEKFRAVIEGKKTIDELFGIKFGEVALTEQYQEDYDTHKEKLAAFVNANIHGKTHETPKKIEETVSQIETFLATVEKTSKDSSFANFIRPGLYGQFYKVLKKEIGKKLLEEEMEIAVGGVFYAALPGEGSGKGNKKEEASEEISFGDDDEIVVDAKEEEGPKIDPLLIYSGRLEGKFKLPDAGVTAIGINDEGIITGEDFLENIEEDSMPKEIQDDLNEAIEEIGARVKIANPWQEALLNMFSVYVIKPAYEAVKSITDIGLAHSLVKKLLLETRYTVAEIFENPKASVGEVKAVITSIRATSLGIGLVLGSKFDAAASMVVQMITDLEQNVEFDHINEVMDRDPQTVAEARLRGESSIVRLQSLTYLMFQLKEENKDNKALLIGVQFAIQILIRLNDDNELLRLSSSMRKAIQAIISHNGAVLAEMPVLEADAILRMVLPDCPATSQEEQAEKKQSLQYKKIEKLLEIVEDSLIKDPEKYSKYNAVLICLVENIKTYLLDANAKDQLLKDWATLQGLIKSIAKDQGLNDPLLQLVMESPGLVEGAITAFYKESTPQPEKGRGQLNRLKTVLKEVTKEYEGNPALAKGLALAGMVLDGFADDQDFFSNINKFEKVLDEVLFSDKYGGLHLSEESKQTLRKVIGYVPINRDEPDEKTIQRIAKSIGPLKDLGSIPPEEMQQRVTKLALENLEIMNLNCAIGGLQIGIYELIQEKAGNTIGPKELALIEYALTNYRDYLCDKYKNSTTTFLLDMTFSLTSAPQINIKMENIRQEAKILSEMIVAIAPKVGAPAIANLVESNLKSIGLIAQASAKKELEKV